MRVTGETMARRPGASGTVRIIGGCWKGTRLRFSAAPGLRPTPDRIRETLFNWLMPYLGEGTVVDLFAGSGALGLEAASRGAPRVILVEKAPRAAAALREHVERLPGARERVELVRQDALRWLRQADLSEVTGIFLDPPYGSTLLDSALEVLRVRRLPRLSWLYIERPSHGDAGEGVRLPEGFRIHRQARAGDVACVLATRENAG